jgi:hypothetical protein
MDVLSLLVGFLLGVYGSIVVVYVQFRNSSAGNRVKQAKEVTKAKLKMKREDYDGYLRNQYRYALGVLICDLASKDDEKGFEAWPTLINEDKLGSENDRWDKFNHYVRPFVGDINAYAFLGAYRYLPFFDLLYELYWLTNLCYKVEVTIALIDASMETPKAINFRRNQFVAIKVDDPRYIAVSKAFDDLYEAWRKWKIICVRNPDDWREW